MKPHCHGCARCCQVLCIPLSSIGFDLKWVEGRGGTIKGMEAFLPSRCKWLTKDNKCEIHEEKPEFCKMFPMNFGPQAWLRNMGCLYYG